MNTPRWRMFLLWTYQNNTFSGNTHLGGENSDGCHVYFP